VPRWQAPVPEHVDCNLCGADDAKLLYRQRDERLRVDDVEWNLVRCRRCGLGYLDPRPTREEARAYYPPSYFTDRARLADRYRRQADYVAGDTGRLLDVGTARGDFLAVMRDRGWDVTGIELSEDAGNPHDLPIHRQRFPEECSFPGEQFDVITAWAVFEHLHDPAAAFAACARLLRPGGSLIVQVPNLNSIHARWARLEDLPRHLYFFTPGALRRYADSVGLELTRVVHTTDLFGGSGRGALRLAFVRALGKSTEDFFEIWRTPKRDRFRRWPALTVGWTAISAVEHVLLADPLVRLARLSGQIVVEIRKPDVAGERVERREAA
jgi:SAM-dependent methyltransferase